MNEEKSRIIIGWKERRDDGVLLKEQIFTSKNNHAVAP